MDTRRDRANGHRRVFERNKKKIMMTQDTCGICGKPVDKTLKNPHPLSPCIDHIYPVSKGGHPSDIDNLQLSHMTCNRQKSDKIFKNPSEPKILGNRNLPQSLSWAEYKASD